MLIKVFIVIALIFIFMAGCRAPEPSPVTLDIIDYTVTSNIEGLSADIKYSDADSSIIFLQGEPLPWELRVTPEERFNGMAYLGALIPGDKAFVPFISGTNSSVEGSYLIDSAAHFISEGVVPGDRIYKDPEIIGFTEVDEVESNTRLKLKSDYYQSSPESYYLYHLINLAASIKFNGVTADEKTVEGYERLEALVQKDVSH